MYKLLTFLILILSLNSYSQNINILDYNFNDNKSNIVIKDLAYKDLKVNNIFYLNSKKYPLKLSVKLGVNTDSFNDFLESYKDNDPTNDGIDFEYLTKSNIRLMFLHKNITYFIGDKIIYKQEQFYIGMKFNFDLNYDN